MNNGTAQYARENGTWFITLSGDLRYPLAPALQALIDGALAEPGEQHFVLDLSQAQTIDSTCLGVLAKIADSLPIANTIRPIIITGNEDIHELLLAVCFDRMFELVESVERRAESQLQPIPLITFGQDDILTLLLETHQRLCAIDAKTHGMFKDVVEAMEADMLKNRAHQLLS